MLTHQQHRTDGPPGGPITGGQVVPSHWRNTPQGGPIPLAGDIGYRPGSTETGPLPREQWSGGASEGGRLRSDPSSYDRRIPTPCRGA